MISRYLGEALHRAHYEPLEDGGYFATVRGLRGVIAQGQTLEACRSQLSEVVEGWILVRVAKGLAIPRLGRVSIRVLRAG
jgi:predicted RNase H-like HicB family nuclease